MNLNIEDLTKAELDAFLDDYYNSKDTVKKVFEKHGLKANSREFVKLLPDIEVETKCEYCNIPMYEKAKSRTTYRSDTKANIFCKNCNHIIHGEINSWYPKICNCENCENKHKERVKKAEMLKLDSLNVIIKKKEESAVPLETLLFEELEIKAYLLALLMYMYDEKSHTFKAINNVKNIKFTPTQEYGGNILNSLMDSSYITLKTSQETLDHIAVREKGDIEYSPFRVEYKINLIDSDTLSFADIVKNTEYIKTYSIEESKMEALELWKKIAFSELLEYLYFTFEYYNFDMGYIGDAIIEKLKLIREEFSVSQGYAILYSSVKSAASFRQSGASERHAVNSINSNISNNISKRKSGEWTSSGFKRNYELKQTALSTVFFNNIIKIGDRGFEQVPCMENIPDSFIDEVDNSFNLKPEVNKDDTRKEILDTLDVLTKEEYSFGELLNLINSKFDEDESINQADDTMILKKLTEIRI